jgi:hypothetical protein
MSDSSAIDQALIDGLLTDAPLRVLMPDGVFWEEAGASLVNGGPSHRCVIVSLVDAVDVPMFGGTAFEDCVYAVKAVALSVIDGVPLPPTTMAAAAARLQVLLHFGTLTIPGYGLMALRRTARLRHRERDAGDSSILWFHRGGHYQLMAAPMAS